MDSKTVLTSFSEEPGSRPEVTALLAGAGLELWHSPEGFWAVRLKRPASPAPRRSLRKAAR